MDIGAIFGGGGGGDKEAALEEAIVNFGAALVNGMKDMAQKASDEIKKRIDDQKRAEAELEKD